MSIRFLLTLGSSSIRELAKYAEAAAIEISPEEDKRLKKLIDRRVLACMVFTYFLQVIMIDDTSVRVSVNKH